MSASQFFFTQLAAGRLPSETIQRQALAFGERTGNVDLLTALASRSGLVEDVDQALAAREDLSVLQAWATRPGRSTEELVARFSTEKRATLLAKLAQLSGLPDEVYRQIAKSQAVTLRWALLENPSVPVDLKVPLASDLGARYTTANSSVYEKVSVIRSLPAEVSAAFLATSSNMYFLKKLARYSETPRHVLEGIIRRCAVLAADADTDVEAFDVATHVVSADAEGELTEFAYQEILGRYDGDSARELPRAASRLTSEISIARRRRSYDAAAALERIGSAKSPADIVSEIERFRREARELGLGASYDDITAQVVRNAHSNADLISTYSAWLTPEQGRVVLGRAIARNDRETAVLVMSRFSRFGVDLFSEAYLASTDPEAFLLWSVGDAKSAPQFVTHAEVVGKDKELAFRLLPIASTLGSASYAAEAEELVVSALGADPELWTTFSTLASEWDGSLTDLLSTVVSFGSS